MPHAHDVSSFPERYRKNLGALTAAECDALQHASVFVAGCGGLGGYVLETLARVGVGRLVFSDPDVFTDSNLNRQLYCEASTLGRSKALTARERIIRVNNSIQADAFTSALTEDNAYQMLSGCQVAVDALDNTMSRRILAEACRMRSIPLVHGAVDGWRMQATVIPPGGNAFSVLYPRNSPVHDQSVLSFTPAVAASIQASETVKLLLGRQVDLIGKLLLVDLLNDTWETVTLPE